MRYALLWSRAGGRNVFEGRQYMREAERAGMSSWGGSAGPGRDAGCSGKKIAASEYFTFHYLDSGWPAGRGPAAVPGLPQHAGGGGWGGAAVGRVFECNKARYRWPCGSGTRWGCRQLLIEQILSIVRVKQDHNVPLVRAEGRGLAAPCADHALSRGHARSPLRGGRDMRLGEEGSVKVPFIWIAPLTRIRINCEERFKLLQSQRYRTKTLVFGNKTAKEFGPAK